MTDYEFTRSAAAATRGLILLAIVEAPDQRFEERERGVTYGLRQYYDLPHDVLVINQNFSNAFPILEKAETVESEMGAPGRIALWMKKPLAPAEIEVLREYREQMLAKLCTAAKIPLPSAQATESGPEQTKLEVIPKPEPAVSPARSNKSRPAPTPASEPAAAKVTASADASSSTSTDHEPSPPVVAGAGIGTLTIDPDATIIGGRTYVLVDQAEFEALKRQAAVGAEAQEYMRQLDASFSQIRSRILPG